MSYEPIPNRDEGVRAIDAAFRKKAQSSLAEATGSAGHHICKGCVHQWQQDGPPPKHPVSWCYMFRTGEHLDTQGFCGQFRLSHDTPNEKLTDAAPENTNDVARRIRSSVLLACL